MSEYTEDKFVLPSKQEVIVYTGEAEAGVFSKRLIVLAKLAMRRQQAQYGPPTPIWLDDLIDCLFMMVEEGKANRIEIKDGFKIETETCLYYFDNNDRSPMIVDKRCVEMINEW